MIIFDGLNLGKIQPKRHLRNYVSRQYLLPFISTVIRISFCFGIPCLAIEDAVSAEKVFVHYGLLQFSLSVKSLEIYAQEGKITGNFADYARFLNQEQLKQFREALVTKADLEPLPIAQFLYSYQGEKILEKIGLIIQTKTGQSGFYAIRSALILAAADKEGLTPLNFLKQFPTGEIKINSEFGFKIIDNLKEIIQESERAISTVEEQALVESSRQTTTVEEVRSLQNYSYRIQLLTMKDTARNRTFPVDLYLPTKPVGITKLPLIVISHGLGSDRSTFAYLAKYLANYGFAVAVPEHPGSSASQINNLLEGFANDVTPPQEFINRPLDITYLLDQLEQSDGTQINTQRVGIIGQSFGAYTALALAGAELNFPELEKQCQNLDESFNLSLLLQCLALKLPPNQISLKDYRIKAAITVNPLTSAIFGQEGMSKINIPVMIVSGSSDPVTPALLEQIRPFTWLTTQEKYLVLMKGGTHFSTLEESAGSIPIPEAAIGPDPKIGQKYLKNLSLIFFGQEITYALSGDNFGCLCSESLNSINDNQMPLSLVTNIDLKNNDQ